MDELERALQELATWDRVLRASVPEEHKGCESPVGAVQSYICALERRPERVVLPDPRQSLESFMLSQADDDACFDGPYASGHRNVALFYWTAAINAVGELNK